MQGAHETLDARAAGSEAALVNEILIDSLGVALPATLLFNPFLMRFTGSQAERAKMNVLVRPRVDSPRLRRWGSLPIRGLDLSPGHEIAW